MCKKSQINLTKIKIIRYNIIMYEKHNNPNTPSPAELERIVAFLMKGVLIRDKARQMEDKDVELPNGETVSVKRQDLAARTGNISLEMQGIDTRTGETMPGNFLLCKAEYLAIAVPDNTKPEGCYSIFLWKHSKLKALAESRAWQQKRLTPKVLEINRSLGKKYDDYVNTLIPLKSAASSDVFVGVNHMDFLALKKNDSYRAFCKLHPVKGDR